MRLQLLVSVGVIISVLNVAVLLAGEKTPGRILCGPTFSVRKNTKVNETVEAMKALGVNCLICFRQDGGDEFLKACDKAGITIILDGTGRAAKLDTRKPTDYYNHSFTGTFADGWNAYLKRAAASKRYHMLCCVPDEMTWHNAQLKYTLGITPPSDVPFYPTDAATAARFKKETGMELPKFRRSRILDGRNPAERRYAVLRYKWADEALRKFARTISDANKNMKTAAVLTSIPSFGLERYPSAMAWDMLGREPFLDVATVTAFTTGYDYRGLDTHYAVSETAKCLASAFGPKVQTGVVTVLYSANMEDDRWSVRRKIDGVYLPTPLRPVDIYGPHIAAVFHGSQVISCYDGRYVDPSARNYSKWKADALKTGFSYVKNIEKCFLEGSEVPEILVLVSRASEDYYQLDHADLSRSEADDGSAGIWEMGGWAQPANRYSWRANRNNELSKGFRADNGMLRYLMKRGYPFVVKYLDQIDTYELTGARTIIMPMPYSVPQAALGKLQKAVKGGATLIIANSLGELDASGQPRKPGPMLTPLMPVSKGGPVRVTGLDFSGWKGRAKCRVRRPYTADEILPRDNVDVIAKTADGKAMLVKHLLGDGAAYFVSNLELDSTNEVAHYEIMDRIAANAFLAGNAVPVPTRKYDDIEAGFRRLGAGGYLGVINWQAKPQKVVYALPAYLVGRKFKAMNLDGSASGVSVDAKGKTVTFELGKHGVKGVLFE